MSEPATSRLRRRLATRINSTYDLIKRVPLAWWAALGRHGIGLAWSRGYPDRRVPALPTAAPPPGAPSPRRAGRVALGAGGHPPSRPPCRPSPIPTQSRENSPFSRYGRRRVGGEGNRRDAMPQAQRSPPRRTGRPAQHPASVGMSNLADAHVTDVPYPRRVGKARPREVAARSLRGGHRVPGPTMVHTEEMTRGSLSTRRHETDADRSRPGATSRSVRSAGSPAAGTADRDRGGPSAHRTGQPDPAAAGDRQPDGRAVAASDRRPGRVNPAGESGRPATTRRS